MWDKDKIQLQSDFMDIVKVYIHDQVKEQVIIATEALSQTHSV